MTVKKERIGRRRSSNATDCTVLYSVQGKVYPMSMPMPKPAVYKVL